MLPSITKAATTPERFRTPTLYYGSAREGFADALRALLIPDNRTVLLPAFIGWSPREGSGVFDPIRQVDAEPRFYAPNRDLTVNTDALEQALQTFKPRVTVVIHYFGRTDPQLEAIGELARRYETILVEDLAHGFFSSASGDISGRVGDFSIFSLHKMFATQTGGMVRYRDPKLLKTQRGTNTDLAALTTDYDWTEIARQRRENFNAVLEHLRQSTAVADHVEFMWPSLDRNDVPQTLPVRLRDVDRNAVYHMMNEDGFGMTSLYHTMIEELRDGFDEMMDLSKSIINFPVHQDMRSEQASAMVDSFEQAISKATDQR